MERCIYSNFAVERKDEYAIQTAIFIDGDQKYSKKIALNEESKAHIKCITENCKILSDIYGKEHVAQCELENDYTVRIEYVDGITLSEEIERNLKERNEEKTDELFGKYVEFVNKSVDHDSVLEDLNFEIFAAENRRVNIDFILDNIILNPQRGFVIIDYEWLVPRASRDFILYRALTIFEQRNNLHGCCDVFEKIHKKYGVKNAVSYKILENKFQNRIFGGYLRNYRKQVRCCGDANITASGYPLVDENYIGENVLWPKMFCEENIWCARFDISNVKAEGRFRFDPLEGQLSRVTVVGIHTDAVDCKVQSLNANCVEGNTYTFYHMDPMLEVIGDFSKATYVEFNYKIKILDAIEASEFFVSKQNELTTERDALAAERDALAANRDALLARIQRIEAIPGWKLLKKGWHTYKKVAGRTD